MKDPALVTSSRKVLQNFSCLLVNPIDGVEVDAEIQHRTELEEAAGEGENSPGLLLDAQSASLVVQIYEALTDLSKSTFEEKVKKLGVQRFIERLWTLVRVNQAAKESGG